MTTPNFELLAELLRRADEDKEQVKEAIEAWVDSLPYAMQGAIGSASDYRLIHHRRQMREAEAEKEQRRRK